MTPTTEPGDRAPQRSARLTSWVRDHPRATGAAVLVSALVLLGVAVVLGWMLLADRPQVGTPDMTPSESPAATSDSSPSPSAAPSPPDASSAPSPSDRPGLAWPPVGVDAGVTGGHYNVWAVVQVNDLNVRSGPGPEHAAIGQLNADDLVLAPFGNAPDSWVEVVGDGIAGHVNTGPSDNPYVLATPTPWNSYYRGFGGVASNGSDYLAFGGDAALDYPVLAGDPSAFVLFSTDGETWTRSAGPGGVHAVAGGPDGWVALQFGHGGVTFTSFSTDGRAWEEPQVPGGSAVAHGPAGWVVVGGSYVRHSPDGRTWADANLPPTASNLIDIATSDAGYVAFGQGGSEVWSSVDGATWSATAVPEGSRGIADAALVGDRLLVALPALDDGPTTLARGTLAASGAVIWDGAPGSIGESGEVVHTVTASPDGLLALGWSSADLVPVAWTSDDGTSWTRQDIGPDALGGSVISEPAWGAAGWIAVGTADHGSGASLTRDGIMNPGRAFDGAAQQLYRSSDASSWSPTGDALAYEGPMPPCPPPSEVTPLVLQYLGGLGEACFGDATLTFRAHVPVLDGLGGAGWPVPDPPWLAGPYAGAYVAPAEGPANLLLGLYVPPGTDQSALAPESWVEVTGHFADPAARTCSRTPDPWPAFYLESLRSTRLECASRFVVEAAVRAEGP